MVYSKYKRINEEDLLFEFGDYIYFYKYDVRGNIMFLKKEIKKKGKTYRIKTNDFLLSLKDYLKFNSWFIYIDLHFYSQKSIYINDIRYIIFIRKEIHIEKCYLWKSQSQQLVSEWY